MRRDVLAGEARPCPCAAGRCPRIVFSVVDLPDALPPSRQTSSPSCDVEVLVLEDVDLPVVGVDPLELRGSACRSSTRVDRTRPVPPRHPTGAEIGLDHLGVGRDLLERALRDLDAVVERDHAIRDPLDDVHVVLDHEDRVAALGAQLPDQLRDLVRLLGVHPGGRLVEQQQRGFVAVARAISRRRRLA